MIDDRPKNELLTVCKRTYASPIHLRKQKSKPSPTLIQKQFWLSQSSTLGLMLVSIVVIFIFQLAGIEAFAPFVKPLKTLSCGVRHNVAELNLGSIPRGKESIEKPLVKQKEQKREIGLEDYAHPREYTNIQVLSTIARYLDQATAGFAFHYADLTPETPTTPLGISFLATNACFLAAGFFTYSIQKDIWLGSLTELAGIMSFWYHYCQLEFGKTNPREVRLALLMDYIVACTTIFTGLVYLAQILGEHVDDGISQQVLIYGTVSLVCLSLSWAREYGYWYLFWHSMWHISSAYEGYLIGQNHYDVIRLVESSASSTLGL